jgi:hypothetical protein
VIFSKLFSSCVSETLRTWLAEAALLPRLHQDHPKDVQTRSLGVMEDTVIPSSNYTGRHVDMI